MDIGLVLDEEVVCRAGVNRRQDVAGPRHTRRTKGGSPPGCRIPGAGRLSTAASADDRDKKSFESENVGPVAVSE